MLEEFSDEILRKTFSDITKGFSFGTYDKRNIYIKHLNSDDQLIIDQEKTRLSKEISEIGLFSEKEKLNMLKENGSWSDKEEAEITSLKEKIENLIVTRKNFTLKTQIDKIEKKIKEEESNLNKILLTNSFISSSEILSKLS